VVDWITWWNQSVANAYIADLTPDKDKTKAFGFIGMLIGIWIVIGPAVGGVSVHLWGNFFWPILVALWFSSFVFLIILFNLRESLKPEERETRPLKEYLTDFFPRQKVRGFLHYKDIPLLLIIVLIFGFVFQWFTTAYVWYTIQAFNLTLIEASGYMIMLGVFFAFNQWFLLRKLTKYFSDTILLFIWFVFLTFGLGIFVYDLGFRWFVITTYFASIWVSFVFSTTKALLTQATPSSRHGAIIGIEESIHSCMRVIAPIVAWFLRWFVGEITFGFFGIFSFLWLLLVYYLLQKWKES
jgi:DHA1 family tetracycline resistance protein-like MFS transporter